MIKWTGNHSESGILRKSEPKEKKEELFVFGYSCKLFRDDDKALHVDQGKHLIPWMGDETLKIDRYDARGALHDLTALEAPSGGYDWRVELTRNELEVEQLCDEERYRALHTDEDEEEMYKEEELKRLHAAGYGQVGFNYDAPAEPEPSSQPAEVDEPFLPTASFKALLPTDILYPETQKQNAIIEKTAKFIASQGAQMEILIKAKQGDNPQFQFLNKDSELNPYYSALIALVKSGKWPEKKPEIVEEKPPEAEEYLHPSLASTVIESAPSIPSIQYKPSADCDYTLLVCRMQGTVPGEYSERAPGEVAPPGTEPLPPRADISRPPVMYNTAERAAQPAQATPYQQYAAYYHQYLAQQQEQLQAQKQVKKEQPTLAKSTGLSLMKNYNTDSESDMSGEDYDDDSSSDGKEKVPVITPPEDIQVVIEKMAAYVTRNGDEFADIVRAKNDPRFTFLDPENIYYPYYKKLMQEMRPRKSSAPVSFSIKKQKDPDPILPKPALPYESSSDEDPEKQAEKQAEKEAEKPEEVKEQPKPPQQFYPINNIPPIVVYKMEGQLTQDLPTIRAIEPMKPIMPKLLPMPEVKVQPKPEVTSPTIVLSKPVEIIKEKTPVKEERKVERIKENSPTQRRERRKHSDRKREYRSKSESRERRSERREERSPDREYRRAKNAEKERKRKKYKEELVVNEIISLEDNSDDLIDLTGDQSDSKGECDTVVEKVKQQERRRRAAEFLKKVGVDPAAAALPTTSLASAMVDNLESRKKKAEEEEKRRRKEKRRHRERREYEDELDRAHRRSKRRKYRSSDDEESDYDGSRKKKRKKEKKHSTKPKKKRRRENEVEEEEDITLPPNIDLTNTLKELRTASPTKDLMFQDIDQNIQNFTQDSTDEEDFPREKRRKPRRGVREYSEGEWSSDSEGDSKSSGRDF
ncbi:hypothetical protein O3G_MSEX011136 [Manduca sexta]|uniref:SURP motif domain-containing protein n=1 Tax=Manduca sexta TaxID=7130 RepID=A0A921ZJP5_MANSE|nr:hypothetical protein O3G_MSEX011136 [Manduca sexta]